MGGGTYSQDVARDSRSSERGSFAYNAYQTTDESGSSHRAVHPALNPLGKTREVNNVTPMVVALDVTRSRGDDTKLVYAKLPMLMGQIELKGYVENPGISFAAIGDATCDAAPLQVGQFEGDNRLDEVLSRMWIEEGGGGTGQESYELAAYFYSRTNTVRLNKGIGRKGYFFFVGDEGFYPQLSKAEVKRVIGDELPEDLDSAEVFRRLHQKFDVFLIYPNKTFASRKADIDAEIRGRVKAAGGQYDNVDVRASLIWNNRNDLDLHIVPPSGERIFYAHKRSACGGWLDVDMNVRGETEKPVENVRWSQGSAPKGRYQVIVQQYSFKEEKHAPTDFKVEIEVNGEIHHVEGTVSKSGEMGPDSNVLVHTFDFDPDARKAPDGAADHYAQYSDDVILKQWATVIPRQRILRIEDPATIIDVILGALAISEGKVDHEGFAEDLRTWGNTEERIAQVRGALAGLTSLKAVGSVEGDVPTPAGGGKPGRSKRL